MTGYIPIGFKTTPDVPRNICTNYIIVNNTSLAQQMTIQVDGIVHYPRPIDEPVPGQSGQ